MLDPGRLRAQTLWCPRHRRAPGHRFGDHSLFCL